MNTNWYHFSVASILLGLVLYTFLMVKESKVGLWLKPLTVAFVSMMAVYFPQWLCNNVLMFSLNANAYLVFFLFVMNVWIMQAADVEKDSNLGTMNLWKLWPKTISIISLLVWILTVLLAFFWRGYFEIPQGISGYGLTALLLIYGLLLLNHKQLGQQPLVRFIPDISLILLLLRF